MKIRLGFVSNSSSSSFVCYGIKKDRIGDMSDERKIKLFNESLESHRGISNYWTDDKINIELEKLDYEKVQDFDEEPSSYLGSLISYAANEYDSFFGIKIPILVHKYPELKLGEIRNFVADKLSDTFGVILSETDIIWIEESWYDS